MEKQVLGVDAAWTANNPSGVALVLWKESQKLKLLKIGRSYDEFCSDNAILWEQKVTGSTPIFTTIIDSCKSNLTLFGSLLKRR